MEKATDTNGVNLSITRGKWALFTCDVQISYNCVLSDDVAFPLKGRKSWFSSIVKHFKEEGWLVFDDFCVCPQCSKYVMKEFLND